MYFRSPFLKLKTWKEAWFSYKHSFRCAFLKILWKKEWYHCCFILFVLVVSPQLLIRHNLSPKNLSQPSIKHSKLRENSKIRNDFPWWLDLLCSTVIYLSVLVWASPYDISFKGCFASAFLVVCTQFLWLLYILDCWCYVWLD